MGSLCCGGTFLSLVHFIPHFTPGAISLFNLTNGETEAQRGQVTSLCHLVKGEQAGLDLRFPDSKLCVCARVCVFLFLSLSVYV